MASAGRLLSLANISSTSSRGVERVEDSSPPQVPRESAVRQTSGPAVQDVAHPDRLFTANASGRTYRWRMNTSPGRDSVPCGASKAAGGESSDGSARMLFAGESVDRPRRASTRGTPRRARRAGPVLDLPSGGLKHRLAGQRQVTVALLGGDVVRVLTEVKDQGHGTRQEVHRGRLRPAP